MDATKQKLSFHVCYAHTSRDTGVETYVLVNYPDTDRPIITSSPEFARAWAERFNATYADEDDEYFAAVKIDNRYRRLWNHNLPANRLP